MSQLKAVTYARVFNLGDYENERIQVEAVINEGESFEEVFEELKQLVNGQAVIATQPIETIANQYVLKNFLGDIITIFEDLRQWLKTFDEGVAKTQDVKRFWNENKTLFYAIKEEVKQMNNPNAEQYVYDIESRLAKALSPVGR